MVNHKRILIVGGVAGGASCATRIRRLDEDAEIVLFERGPYISFANCGLPYHLGGVIPNEADLLAASPETFLRNFRIEVRTCHEVTAIDRIHREIEVHNLAARRPYRERYDALLLSPGATPTHPPVRGIDLPGIFSVRTIPDCRRIQEWIGARKPRHAVVVGAGFLGLELAENLVRRGLQVTIVEKLPQVAPILDPEMAEPVCRHLESHGVALQLADGLSGFEQASDCSLIVRTESDAALPADLVILALGVKPQTTLAAAAGLTIGQTGGIRVDESMRTNDADIWAVGDAVEIRDLVTGQPCLAALAGPAHRQARVAADSICGRTTAYRGSLGTAVFGCMGLTIAVTGASETRLRQAGVSDYETTYLHPPSHARYYPDAKRLHMKLIFGREDGRVLGAQVVGEEGAERRIDVVAMAIQKQASVFDLAECDLCYAPQFGSAKDPVNLAGMVASNFLCGDAPQGTWISFPPSDVFLVDVRDPDEFAAGHIDTAINIPLHQLRSRLFDLPRKREIWLYCGIGQRSYYALRILLQRGFQARTLPGGYETYWGWTA